LSVWTEYYDIDMNNLPERPLEMDEEDHSDDEMEPLEDSDDEIEEHDDDDMEHVEDDDDMDHHEDDDDMEHDEDDHDMEQHDEVHDDEEHEEDHDDMEHDEDEDDMELDEDDDDEPQEQEQEEVEEPEECDGWCQWEYSEWNNWDDEWDEATKAQYWYEKSQITGCDMELECEFYVCEDDEVAVVSYEANCWREECNSDCGEYLCGLWHQNVETEDWEYTECAEEYDLSADLLENAQAAAEFVQQFDQTFNIAQQYVCESGNQ